MPAGLLVHSSYSNHFLSSCIYLMYVSQSIICIYLCLFVFKWKNVRFPKAVKLRSGRDNFVFYLRLFHEHSRFTWRRGKGEAIFLTPLYHFHPLQTLKTLAGRLLQTKKRIFKNIYATRIIDQPHQKVSSVEVPTSYHVRKYVNSIK